MCGALLVLALSATAFVDDPAPAAPAVVSFHKQVRPILQANCQGCHQPAKAGGRYVMTLFDRLTAGGESELPAIVPGKPEESNLVDSITPDPSGKHYMPREKPALAEADRKLIADWIAQGAVDDTPANAVARYDTDHPPIYTRPPVLSALDVSPDGQLLAVAGFHEVLLWKADGSELVGRLIGQSERIESVKFSPDGQRLAVTGGNPGRFGELQIWDVASKALKLSVPVTYDTVYGAAWSPDGASIAFGGGDNSVRVVDAATGEQKLFMGAHSDWVLDTVFSKDGSNLISVGRDMAVKLTDVATQRFIDNITSITPGALKGGVQAVTRHPERDEIVIGGSDGVPKVYRVFRQVTRVIGDDSNIIRQFPAMPGRIFGVAVSADGKRVAAASSNDGAGQVAVYAYEFDTGLPDDVKAIMAKVSHSAEEEKRLDAYKSDGARQVSKIDVPAAGMYAVAFRPDGVLVAAGGDGLVRLIDGEKGQVVQEFAPVQVSPPSAVAAAEVHPPDQSAAPATPAPDALPPGAEVVSIAVEPKEIKLGGPFEYAQLVVTASLASGDVLDATRMVEPTLSANIADVSPAGLITPRGEGQATVSLSLAGKSIELPITVAGLLQPRSVDFAGDVAPVLSRLGCNAGTCHGSAQGKNGFKLSLRGYDRIFDLRALTDDHAARRVNVASPDDSLMLLKPTGAVAHAGGVLTAPGESYYQIIRGWIAAGARLDQSTPRVASLAVFPLNPVVGDAGAKQQLRVLATFSDGQGRDVTREAYLDSGNNEVATAAVGGLMTALRRGEAPVLVRYEGAYAATTLTVMGDRTGFAWEEPPAYGRIDELVADKWERMKIRPSGLCTDAEYLRRIYLDLTGLPPSSAEVRSFLDDPRDSRLKRADVVERLIGSPEFVDFWTNKWADLLQVNRKFLDVEGATAFRSWIREQVANNAPYDKFVREILTASGSNKENPAASYYKILREPTATMENTTQLFLAVRFNCNKCHDHPFERWTQDQYYETAAYFAQVGLKADPSSGDRRIGGSAVEGSTPLYEFVEDTGAGEVTHIRTNKLAPPKFPYDCDYAAPEEANRRVELAAWMTSPENPYFAKSYVNRIWGYLLGTGIIEPLDDIRAGNPATNPELLDHLTAEFIKSGFDVRYLMRLIANSRAYQLSIATNPWNDDDKTNFSHAIARRLPAEVLLDAVYRVTGSQSNIPGVPAGTRAAALPDSGVELPSGFLGTFGRPVRESACECERSSGLQLGPIMALVSGPTLGDAIADPANKLAELAAGVPDDRTLIQELFLRILNRPATDGEIDACLAGQPAIEQDHAALAAAVAEREAFVFVERPRLEAAREAAIADAKAAVAAREAEIAPQVAEQEKQRQDRIAAAQAQVAEYAEKLLPARIAAWEALQSGAVDWVVIQPKDLTASVAGTKLTRLDDGSIFAEGENAKGLYTITAETDLKGITAVRLEAIPDDRLPAKSAGRAADGNFVLTELELSAAPKADPAKSERVTLRRPLADFSQNAFEIAKAIDGNATSGDQGWAVAPSYGVTHWATFETKADVGHDGGSLLTFNLHHRFNGNLFALGRFRLAVAVARRPVGLSLADDLRAVLAIAPEDRAPEQSARIAAYYQSIDPEHQARQAALAQANAPVPTDPTLLKLRADLVAAELPVPDDAKLAALKRDLAMSEAQVASRRLTTAQDVAWALINSPAFLFNH